MESPAQIEDKSAASPSPRPLWRRPVVLTLALVTFAGACGGAFWWGWRGGEDEDAAEAAQVIASASSAYVELPEIVANLSTGAAPRFVKVRVVLRAAAGRASEIEDHQTEIQDAFVGYLNALHPDELYGAAGFERLRAALRRRAAVVLADAGEALDDVLIVEFIRQ